MSIESVLVSKLLKEFLTDVTCYLIVFIYSFNVSFNALEKSWRLTQDSSFALFKKANENETGGNMQYRKAK